MRFEIGEFSKLCQVTVKTLRHYEEIGLLIPFEVDEWTGYRYYDIGQLRQMTRIVYLKRLGFSLEEIAELYAYAEANGYEVSGRPRFCYMDGIWNKVSVDEWLTEIQLPVNR